MHIPSSKTTEIKLMSFEDALSAALLPQEDYDTGKWLYVPPFYSEYRYILGTVGKDPLICIGINPSTAAPDALDNTLKSVERIAHFNGHDSFIMFNVYAQRATNPDDMEKDFNKELHKQNMLAFEYILSQCKSTPCVWAAWGNIIEKRAYLPALIRDFAEISKKYGAGWYTCGAISKKGHPHHPLYLRADTKKDPFDILGYLDGMRI
ncbi:MAG: DUF1643 domain-containing protein [Clostridia bacterium]|nr:DUF1643 domain-containing protein [Clostridia bacterium]